jgi:hypothetical protein
MFLYVQISKPLFAYLLYSVLKFSIHKKKHYEKNLTFYDVICACL